MSGVLAAAVREARMPVPASAAPGLLRSEATEGNALEASVPGRAEATPEGREALRPAADFEFNRKEGRFPPREVPLDRVAKRKAERPVPGSFSAEMESSAEARNGIPVRLSTEESDLATGKSELQIDSGVTASKEKAISRSSFSPGITRVGLPTHDADSLIAASDRDARLLISRPKERLLGRRTDLGTPSEISAPTSPADPGSAPAAGGPARSATGKPGTREDSGQDGPRIQDPVPPPSAPIRLPGLEAIRQGLGELGSRLDRQAEALALGNADMRRRLRETRSHAEPAGPQVRIGQVEVFVTAPAPPPAKTPASASDKGWSSRNYLRRA